MGTNYDPTAVARLTPGMSHAAVIAMLGTPNATVTLADGSQLLTWLHSRGSMFGAQARSVTLQFGADGRYIRTVSQVATDVR
jgi:hypothetical protein